MHPNVGYDDFLRSRRVLGSISRHIADVILIIISGRRVAPCALANEMGEAMRSTDFLKVILLCSAVGISGCTGDQSRMNELQSSNASQAERLQSYSADGYAESDTSKQSSSAPQPPPDQSNSENPSTVSFLAYRYNYQFALPVKSVAATAKSHAEKCVDAGPSKCQLLSSNTNIQSKDFVSARLSLRAEPEWLTSFTNDIATDVTDAKGEMTGSGVQAEDLTRSILDTDARLKAKTVLRTRLENLLETRNAKLPDLMALERELARVQAEIESATTMLNVLRKRVSMSVVDINYQTKTAAISSSSVSPIGKSLKGFVRNFAYALSDVIDFIAGILPWLIVIIPGLWFFRKWWRKRKSTKS